MTAPPIEEATAKLNPLTHSAQPDGASCGGIDQGEALYRGEPRLTLTKDGHGGQALPVGDNA
jgi:hypothetical protein